MKITLEQKDVERALRDHLKANGVEADNIAVKMKRSAQGVFTAVVDTNAEAEVDESEEENTDGEQKTVFG